MSEKQIQTKNPMGHEPVGKLLARFAVPAIIGNLVSAIYNITDQIFIGQGVGMMGNAATSVAFPITTICTAIALLFGIGGAASFNLEMGRGNHDKAKKIVGSTFGCLFLSGIAIFAVIRVFLHPLLELFGATDQIMEYAVSYVSITNFGIPFLLISTGGSNLVRSDGKPAYSMISILVGAVLNMVLDPIFIFVFHWGVAGAAAATTISQIVSSIMIISYLPRFRSVKIVPRDLIPKLTCVKAILSLGVSSFINQIASFTLQIAMNSTLRHYGALSAYGSEIPLAAMGIISKINMIIISVVLGIAQGGQPILGYNYGARQYLRVRKTFRYILTSALAFSCVAFLCFQLFPGTFIGLFGTGDELYLRFATRLLRIYMFFTFLNCCQPIASTVFTAIGKPLKGAGISLTRQILFLMPLVVLLPRFLGIDGVVYAGPIADLVAFAFAASMLAYEFWRMPRENEPMKTSRIKETEAV
ncbi:MAG TPA: MATE family efflux transporter [Candidatus Pelethocola excrementipullorum]|nr:MATE family efflux transporter [Candidatus Pelethocola excrementipullorum]